MSAGLCHDVIEKLLSLYNVEKRTRGSRMRAKKKKKHFNFQPVVFILPLFNFTILKIKAKNRMWYAKR